MGFGRGAGLVEMVASMRDANVKVLAPTKARLWQKPNGPFSGLAATLWRVGWVMADNGLSVTDDRGQVYDPRHDSVA